MAAAAGAALLAAGSLFQFVRRWADERTAGIAPLVLATTPLLVLGAQYANHDMLVAGCIGASILLAAHALRLQEGGAAHGPALLGAYAFAALGVLTKGLIGAVLPALVFAAWCIATRRRRAWRCLAWWPGWLRCRNRS